MGSLAIQPNSRRAYALAIVLLLLAVALQWAIRPVIGSRLPYLFFFPAVGIAAMWGGWRPAMLVLIGAAVHAFFWVEPTGPLSMESPGGQVALVGFLVAGGLLLVMGSRMSTLRARAVDAENSLAEQVQDLQALHLLSSNVQLLPGLKQQLQAILKTLCEIQGAQKGIVWLCNPGQDMLHVAASLGFSAQALREMANVPVGAGASGQAFATRGLVVIADTQSDPSFAAYRGTALREGFLSVHSRPLLDPSGQVLGAISIHFAAQRTPTARENRLGDLCARLATVLVERNVAMEQASTIAHRLEVALDTSAVPFCLLQPITDAAGAITGFRWDYLNAAAARLLQRPADEVKGRPVRDFLTGNALEPGLLGRAVQALQSGKTVQFETWVEALGARRWFQVIASPYGEGLAVWFADVTGRKAHEQALRDADRRKDEFLATLAHELRNPLAPIRQAAQIAKSPAATDKQKAWSHDVIERQVAHMARLLDDLLDVSRITRGKLELRRSVVRLDQVVDSALEAARPQVETRRQQLRTQLPPEPLWVDGDAMRLAQVLSNLLTNAAKYTQPEGSIQLLARRDGDWVVAEVRDNGIGLDATALERIFEMFTQLRTQDSAGTTGLGIGLALSRGLAQLHGGSLQAASDGPGAGSTFTLRLPAAAAPVDAEPVAPQGGRSGRRRRVLVADDNRDAAQSLADLLRMEGHEVAIAFDGEEALQEYGRFAPEIALLDIGMPRLTGNQVASEIRRRPEGAGTVLVAITGWGQERDRTAAREAGFDHHFTKPVDPQQVLELLDSASG